MRGLGDDVEVSHLHRGLDGDGVGGSGQQDHRRVGERAFLSHGHREVHVFVGARPRFHEHHIEGPPLCRRQAQLVHAVVPKRARFNLRAEPLDALGERASRDLVRVDHQHAAVGQVGHRRDLGRIGRHGERKRHPECRPSPVHRPEPSRTAHHLGDAAGDRQAETRAPETPGHRRVTLAEVLEDARLQGLGYPDARVVHRKAEHGDGTAPLDHVDFQHHMAKGRELQGIRQQVQRDLPDASRVSDELRRHPATDVHRQRDLLLVGPRRQQVAGLLQRADEVERQRLDGELAGLDLGEVEDVVDDGEQ